MHSKAWNAKVKAAVKNSDSNAVLDTVCKVEKMCSIALM